MHVTMFLIVWKTARRTICTLNLSCLVFVFLTEVSPACAVTVQVMKTLRHYHVIPDVIDVAPTSVMQVRYPNHVVVEIGRNCSVKETASKPLISWPADSDGYYTLMMTDPDSKAPSASEKQEFLHWLVVNINGSSVSQAETKAEYLGPLENSKEGIHRYVLTAFRQRGEETFNETFLTATDIDQRANFSALEFIKEHEFGYPVAVNFFRVDFEKLSDAK